MNLIFQQRKRVCGGGGGGYCREESSVPVKFLKWVYIASTSTLFATPHVISLLHPAFCVLSAMPLVFKKKQRRNVWKKCGEANRAKRLHVEPDTTTSDSPMPPANIPHALPPLLLPCYSQPLGA